MAPYIESQGPHSSNAALGTPGTREPALPGNLATQAIYLSIQQAAHTATGHMRDVKHRALRLVGYGFDNGITWGSRFKRCTGLASNARTSCAWKSRHTSHLFEYPASRPHTATGHMREVKHRALRRVGYGFDNGITWGHASNGALGLPGTREPAVPGNLATHPIYLSIQQAAHTPHQATCAK